MFQELLRTVTICSDMCSFFQSYSNPASSMARRFGTQPGVQTQRPMRQVWLQLDSIHFCFLFVKNHWFVRRNKGMKDIAPISQKAFLHHQIICEKLHHLVKNQCNKVVLKARFKVTKIRFSKFSVEVPILSFGINRLWFAQILAKSRLSQCHLCGKILYYIHAHCLIYPIRWSP